MSYPMATPARLDSKARSAARRVGLLVRRSRRQLSIDNRGGYMVVDPYLNMILAGEKYELTAEDVLEFCRPETE